MSAWLIGLVLAFASLPDSLRPSIGPLFIALVIAGAAGTIVTVCVHLRPSLSMLVASLVAFVFSMLWTLRDLQWVQGDGRNDGQAALVFLDPILVVPGFAAALALTLGSKASLRRFRAR